MAGEDSLKVGTRKSQLALVQTDHVVALLKSVFPGLKIEIVPMSTTGDHILDSPLHQIGSKSLFTKELEVALLDNCVDLVVHSLKDLPTTLPEGLCIGSVLERESEFDVLVLRKDINASSISELKEGSVIGTSSVRRIAQLKHFYPHLKFKDIRGNLNTRLKKLDDESEGYDGIVLAEAGMNRLNWKDRISQVLQPGTENIFYAVGQGALGIECRVNDTKVLNYLKSLTHKETYVRCCAERSLLKKLEGGCSVPIGVETVLNDLVLSLIGIICSVDGTQRIIASDSIKLSNLDDSSSAERLGLTVAENLFKLGAKDILATIKRH